MSKEHDEVIKEHIRASEEAEGIVITGFHFDYNGDASVEELSTALSRLRETQALFNQIDPLTMAEAKIVFYEELLGKIRKFGQSTIAEWIDMPESERKLRHEIFTLTDMGMFAGMEYYIDFAKKKGVI